MKYGPVVETEVVDRDQVGVIERAGEPRLLLEAMDQLGVAGQSLVDDLEGDVSPQPCASPSLPLQRS